MGNIRNENVLNGLAQIARYLDITSRTVLNWESMHRLPLHRPAGISKVYAYKTEIEVWRKGGKK